MARAGIWGLPYLPSPLVEFHDESLLKVQDYQMYSEQGGPWLAEYVYVNKMKDGSSESRAVKGFESVCLFPLLW